MSEVGSLEVRNKLKATALSFSGHGDPFSVRAKAIGTCGAEGLSQSRSASPVVSIGK